MKANIKKLKKIKKDVLENQIQTRKKRTWTLLVAIILLIVVNNPTTLIFGADLADSPLLTSLDLKNTYINTVFAIKSILIIPVGLMFNSNLFLGSLSVSILSLSRFFIEYFVFMFLTPTSVWFFLLSEGMVQAVLTWYYFIKIREAFKAKYRNLWTGIIMVIQEVWVNLEAWMQYWFGDVMFFDGEHLQAGFHVIYGVYLAIAITGVVYLAIYEGQESNFDHTNFSTLSPPVLEEGDVPPNLMELYQTNNAKNYVNDPNLGEIEFVDDEEMNELRRYSDPIPGESLKLLRKEFAKKYRAKVAQVQATRGLGGNNISVQDPFNKEKPVLVTKEIGIQTDLDFDSNNNKSQNTHIYGQEDGSGELSVETKKKEYAKNSPAEETTKFEDNALISPDNSINLGGEVISIQAESMHHLDEKDNANLAKQRNPEEIDAIAEGDYSEPNQSVSRNSSTDSLGNDSRVGPFFVLLYYQVSYSLLLVYFASFEKIPFSGDPTFYKNVLWMNFTIEPAISVTITISIFILFRNTKPFLLQILSVLLFTFIIALGLIIVGWESFFFSVFYVFYKICWELVKPYTLVLFFLANYYQTWVFAFYPIMLFIDWQIHFWFGILTDKWISSLNYTYKLNVISYLLVWVVLTGQFLGVSIWTYFEVGRLARAHKIMTMRA